MKAHECYHCKAWVAEGEFHDCWTTTEAALTRDLPEDLQDAYERIRDTAVGFGEQRVYASGSCIMFARATCYFFVRPKRQWLELAVFLPRAVTSPVVKRVEPKSRVKFAHIVRITHRDEVEAPLTDWLKEAYDFEPLAKAATKTAAAASARRSKPASSRKKTVRPRTRPKVTRARKMSTRSRKR